MAILQIVAEDIDCTDLGACVVSSGGGTSPWRTAFARTAIKSAAVGNTCKSNPFPGGAVTSAWMTCRVLPFGATTSQKGIAFGLSGTTKGLAVGLSAASSTRVALSTFDGTTRTQLAAETGNSLTNNVLNRIDVQVVNYGATATVNVWVNLVQVISFSGNVTVTGMANFDSVFIYCDSAGDLEFSEIIVSSTDTRGIYGLMTMALTGAGTTDAWASGTFSNINGTTISDANPANTNTTGQNEQFNITDVTGTVPVYSVTAVKISARLAASAGATATQVKLGYNSGGSVAFGTGATKTPTPAFTNYEQLDAVNPITGVAFVSTEMNALQVNLQSA